KMTEGRTSLSIAGCFFGVIGAIIGFAVVNPSLHIGADASIDKALVDAANRYNKMLPMMIDSETRGDSMIPRPPNTMVYRYTLVKRTKAELGSKIPALVKILRRQVTN